MCCVPAFVTSVESGIAPKVGTVEEGMIDDRECDEFYSNCWKYYRILEYSPLILTFSNHGNRKSFLLQTSAPQNGFNL
jgi:hypothetical protein